MDKPRNFLITDVEINYPRLDTPINPFGTEIYEIQIATTDKAKADELKANHFNVKERDGKFTVSLKRNAKKRDGSDNGKVRVVDGNKMPMENTRSIGNGSKGNVIVWQFPYEAMGRKGVSGSLTALQVTELVEYNGGAGGVDFDVVDSAPSSEQPSADLF